VLMRRNAGKSWTEVADDKLRQLAAQDVRWGDIAVVLGRTREAATRRAAVLRLKLRS
jgi:hypothetical protein